MRFFEKFFEGAHYAEATGQLHVVCPFPHKNADGTVYRESNASAHVDATKGVFHCKNPSCISRHSTYTGVKGGLSESGFMAVMQGITYGEAIRILKTMEGQQNATDQWENWHQTLVQNDSAKVTLQLIGLEDMEKVLNLGFKGRGIVFPIFIYGEYMGACDYHPFPEEGQKKAILEKGTGQAIFPFDLWREDERDTFLCAGFKDAAMARKHGLNAITFTHGEGSFPKLYKRSFKGRRVFICYDNDEGGREGARKTAALLKEVGATPVIVDLSSVCTEAGEDIHDYLYKYEKTAEDLKELAEASPLFSDEEYEDERNEIYPLVSLAESTSGKAVGRVLSSRVAVVAEFTDWTARIPDVVEFTKVGGDGDFMNEGDTVLWTLEDKNIEDILYLMDGTLKEHEIDKYLKKLANVYEKNGIIINKMSYVNVHKCVVVDDQESEVLEKDSMTKSYSPLEMTMYSIGDEGRMVNGDKYRIFFKTTGHPLKGSQIFGIVTKVEPSDNTVNNFKVTEDILETLKCFQVQEGETVKDKMSELFERSKALLGPEANKPVFYATELFYHTPLDFKFDENRTDRAYLEAMIVGESRTHKSATAKGLLATYGLGAFVSLQNATTRGLIGGSAAQGGGGYKTRLGVIPRNHKGAVILEEFSKAPADFISSMTDIRSSNMVRISRVNGETTAPAQVRMLSLSNAKASSGGTTIPLNQYPSGVKVLLELVGLAEDINRYDFFVIKDEGEYIDPTTPVLTEAYDKKAYENRIRWIWSRKPENVMFNERLRKFVTECANELNRRYQTHIQFFGREAWKKLSRVAIAVAACVCSYDETGENLKVTEEHVVWAKNYMIACYDNDIFKLARYVSEERELSQCDTTDIQVLQGLYNRNETVIDHIDRGTEFSHAQLRAVSGMNNDDYNKLINRLTGGKFIQFSGDKIRPTQKFRKAIGKVEMNKMKRV